MSEMAREDVSQVRRSGHDLPMTATERERVEVGGLPIDPLTETDVVEQVRAELRAGRGGWIATPNVDHLRHAARDPRVAAMIRSAHISVADGAPVVWAAKLSGRPIPARVTGADAEDGRSVYLLGGETGVPERAADALRTAHPELKIAGTCSPPRGFELDEVELAKCR